MQSIFKVFLKQLQKKKNRMKNVIHIFGAAGSGTTTLGMKICQELGYKLMDTDDYFWLPTERWC